MCAASVYREGGTSAKKINEFILLCFRFALSLQLLNDDGRWGTFLFRILLLNPVIADVPSYQAQDKRLNEE
jgi:hypothetical protein